MSHFLERTHTGQTSVTFRISGAVSITESPSPVTSTQGSRGNHNPARILQLPISTREMHSFLHLKIGPAYASSLTEDKPSVFNYVSFQDVYAIFT